MSKGTKRANKVITTNRDVLKQALINEKLLTQILKNQKIIMASIKELTAQVDELQTALDEEQEQIKKAIGDLQAIVDQLNANIGDGGTVEERQALSDKIAAVKTDLQGTIPDETTPEQPPQ